MKISKQYAKYQYEPKDGNDCDECKMFREPDKCTLVEGKISPEGWCRFYERDKRKKKDEEDEEHE